MKKDIKVAILITAMSFIGMAAIVNPNNTEKKLTFKNTLILGNSITRHQPAAQLG